MSLMSAPYLYFLTHTVMLDSRERDYFYYIIVQTYDVGLHSRRHPMGLDAGTRPVPLF